MKTGWKSLIVAGVILMGATEFVVAGAGGGPAHGNGPGSGPGPGAGEIPHSSSPVGPGRASAGGMFKPLAWSLNLTEQQTAQIDGILARVKPQIMAADNAVAIAQGALHQAVITGSTEEHIRAAALTVGDAMAKQAVLHAKMLVSTQAVLTTDQRAQLAQIQAQQSHSEQGTPGSNDSGRTVPHSQSGLTTMSAGPRHQVVSGGPAPREHLSLDQVFKGADANKDGVLTQQEFQDFHETLKAAQR